MVVKMSSYFLILRSLGHGFTSFQHFRDNNSAAFSVELMEMFVVHVEDGIVQTHELLRDLQHGCDALPCSVEAYRILACAVRHYADAGWYPRMPR